MEMQGTQRTELKFNVEIIIIKKKKQKAGKGYTWGII